ncbi:hypothetical protein DEU56DRAFT_747981 [Suillus clintonianus]|uniref:uncharacterized protein n=1 Tax=Suillus clintonianus TaxID=1904413 RepID=UPI001B85CC82|nr:uncharacterized protein DEU56DRAFT_747981 [Suillus clintonianus]KAG2117727.1 hypothetical protein DEU56DRAFT_747981 [Suillus clintonianus]
MVEKTLSTGTLNLRFMQNARRAQQLSSVELEKAHVKDDAEWEVAPDIRKAWGLADGGNDDLYERSYMPFLFPSVSETPRAAAEEKNGISSGVKPQGRRKFNKNGEEVSISRIPRISSKPPEVRSAVVDVQPEETRKIKIKSISSSTSTLAKPSKKLKEPASRVIYDNSNVGVDLRSLSSNSTSSAPKSTSTAFMKPAGVDDPSSAPSSKDAFSTSAASSARKGKRRQDNAEVETTGLKKKKTSFIE